MELNINYLQLAVILFVAGIAMAAFDLWPAWVLLALAVYVSFAGTTVKIEVIKSMISVDIHDADKKGGV